MSLFRKLVAGGPNHKSRLHDEKGNRLDAAGLVYLPASVATLAARLAVGYRPAVPWVGYRAIRRLGQVVTKQTSVIEFGSGMSTVWFARKAARVTSVEDYRPWYDKVAAQLAGRGVKNVTYRFCPTAEYPGTADLPAGSFDFALIDGTNRAGCAAEALRLVRPGGHVYLDNSDKDANDPAGDCRRAEETLKAGAASAPEYFTDLVPTYLMVTQGMLVRTAGG